MSAQKKRDSYLVVKIDILTRVIYFFLFLIIIKLTTAISTSAKDVLYNKEEETDERSWRCFFFPRRWLFNSHCHYSSFNICMGTYFMSDKAKKKSKRGWIFLM